MRFGWVVLKHFCALCGMVGLYVGLMPGGMGMAACGSVRGLAEWGWLVVEQAAA